jgi:hypothetical protein
MSSSTQPHFLVDRNLEHLRLLGIYHRVIAFAVALLGIFLYGLPLVMGAPLFSLLFPWLPTLSPGVSSIQLGKGLLVMLVQVTVLGLNGWWLQNRKNWLSCVILSCIECLCSFPLGLLLGISAVLVLRRESVHAIFSMEKNKLPDSCKHLHL